MTSSTNEDWADDIVRGLHSLTSDQVPALEVILLDQNVDDPVARYTGSVRVIYPVEGEAVKFYGECRAGNAG